MFLVISFENVSNTSPAAAMVDCVISSSRKKFLTLVFCRKSDKMISDTSYGNENFTMTQSDMSIVCYICDILCTIAFLTGTQDNDEYLILL